MKHKNGRNTKTKNCTPLLGSGPQNTMEQRRTIIQGKKQAHQEAKRDSFHQNSANQVHMSAPYGTPCYKDRK
jgi:hypothetical protein